VGYVLTEPRIRVLEAVCRHGSVVYSGRFGKTARILEEMRLVTVEYSVVWIRQKRRYSVDTVPRCRWTVQPTVLGLAMFHRLTQDCQPLTVKFDPGTRALSVDEGFHNTDRKTGINFADCDWPQARKESGLRQGSRLPAFGGVTRASAVR
jgi:hypothetical protein